jgi:hypothetical protein
MKNKIILFSLLQFMIIGSAVAQSSFFSLEPIVGYERVQALLPEPHTKDRLIYGLRASLGPRLLAIEVEATQGKDTESFPDDDLTISETAINAMVGLKSVPLYGRFIKWHIRAGGHARKVTRESTEAGVKTTTEPDIAISPYAGTGLSFTLGPMFTLSAGITAIFTNEPLATEPEYQTTLGFSIRI